MIARYARTARLAMSPMPQQVRCLSLNAKDLFLDQARRATLSKQLGVQEDRIVLTIQEMREIRGVSRDQKVGFVPTMGALHEGHVSLLETAKKENDLVVSSIFVNPAQFAPHEDFGKYPRQIEKDLAIMFDKGVDYVFAPHQFEMYPNSQIGQTSTQVTKTHVLPEGVDFISEGAARPGFFRGVATVVCKLLNIVQPTRLYLGQKDGLQVIVVRRMCRDLNIPVQVRPCDTVREADGLAKSSRNIYLSAEQRAAAPRLYQALCEVRGAFERGERSYHILKHIGQSVLDEEPLFATEYLSICDSLEGTELDSSDALQDGNIMVSAAVRFENCRILDNVLLGPQH